MIISISTSKKKNGHWHFFYHYPTLPCNFLSVSILTFILWPKTNWVIKLWRVISFSTTRRFFSVHRTAAVAIRFNCFPWILRVHIVICDWKTNELLVSFLIYRIEIIGLCTLLRTYNTNEKRQQKVLKQVKLCVFVLLTWFSYYATYIIASWRRK